MKARPRPRPLDGVLRDAVATLLPTTPTPFYVLDVDAVAQAYTRFHRAWAGAFPTVTVAYSYKTNPLPCITTRLAALGSAAELVSGPEIAAAVEDGFTPDAMYFDGPVKPAAELQYALRLGVTVQVDSLAEIDQISRLHAAEPTSSKVTLRIAVSRGRGQLSRFGLAPDEMTTAWAALERAGLPPAGVHFNAGGNLLDPRAHAAVLKDAAPWLRRTLADREVAILDIGGGYAASSASADQPIPEAAQYVEHVARAVDSLGLERSRLHLVTEPGRCLTEDHGVLALSVAATKRRGRADVVTLDGGSNLARSIAYWYHPIGFLRDAPAVREYTVYGAQCYESDVVAATLPGPADVTVGDVVYIGNAGAYDLTTANVWTRPAPPVFYCAGGQIALARAAGATIR